MTFRIHRGGQARTVKGVQAKQKIRRELHGLAISVQGERTVAAVAEIVVREKQVMSWWFDLRRGHLPVYGSLLRFIDVSIALGTPKAALLLIPQWISSYIEEQYEPPRAGRMKKVA